MPEFIQNAATYLPLDPAARLFMAAVAGAVIGWERERQDKPAGLRTHMLVSLGAAMFMIAGLGLAMEPGFDSSVVRLDPTRALQGVIGGVGFLGAGTIIQARGSVRGITTAASIWISAALGACCGMGLYQLAILCAVFALLVLWGVGYLEVYVVETRKKPREDGGEER